MHVGYRCRSLGRIDPYATLMSAFVALAAGLTPVAAEDLPGAGKSVQAAANGILEDLFVTDIAIIGLEKLGYQIKPTANLDITSMHIAVGQGDADFTTQHYEPVQNALYEKAGGDSQMEKVGTILDDGYQGYLIDKRTADKFGIKTIDQLSNPTIAKIFDSDGDGKADLTGCNPGWGCEGVIEHQLDAYQLRETVTHNQGSYFALMADTITRFNAGRPILYYTWTPLWVNAILVPGKDVVWLGVPFTSLPDGEVGDTHLPDGTNVGFTKMKVRVAANRKFIDSNPAAKRFFELLKVLSVDINDENLQIYKGEDKPENIRQHAEGWVKKNSGVFEAWVDDAKKTVESK
ncbi:glycine betaine/L-proline ABC transporter substrate-binding protein ProX [Mesorhizobium sp. M1403]|uniref:glycine betaine/L-proline ABC transporter substrate-binding protein ProX n=1 Tax=Mesorhizobium sp. M1403 TaxID=2957097 RepID=UPI00333AC2C8